MVKTLGGKRFFVPVILLALCTLLISPVFFVRTAHASSSFVGVKENYLAIGDSLAFGFQADLDFKHGYATDFASYLEQRGSKHYVNLACPGESSVTMLNGHCPYPYLRKYPYVGAQLNAALLYLALHRGKVSPVTLDIGANDVLSEIDTKTCSIDATQFRSNLAQLDYNLKNVILPELRAALTVNGKLTGDLLVMNFYNPYQYTCPATIPYVVELNQHLAADIQGFATLVDTFGAFGGANLSYDNLCLWTWMCKRVLKDIHATDAGYRLIAQTFENTVQY